MSRLKSHQKKKFLASIIFYLTLLAVVLYFIFTFGIKLLINASLFIANLNQKTGSRVAAIKSNDFYGKINIDSIPTATNSSTIIVSGSVLNLDLIEFYLNDEKVKKTSSSTSDSFSEEINELKKGENKVYVIAKSQKNKKEKKSSVFTVVYIDEKPKLEINEPQDLAKVNQQDVRISGSTNKETFVKINEAPIVVDAQGNFQTTFRLHDGENKIEIIAQDVAGNIQTKTLTITYQKED